MTSGAGRSGHGTKGWAPRRSARRSALDPADRLAGSERLHHAVIRAGFEPKSAGAFRADERDEPRHGQAGQKHARHRGVILGDDDSGGHRGERSRRTYR